MKVDLIPGLPQNPYRNGVGAYEGIVIHDTECPGDSDESEVKYFKANWKDRRAFIHYFCDDDSITQAAKVEYQAWGAGKGNPRYLHIEMITATTQQSFDEVYKRTCWLAAKKLYERKLGVVDGKTLVTHEWVTKNLGGTTHTDPIAYLKKWGKTWVEMVRDVKANYDEMAKPIVVKPPVSQPPKQESKTVSKYKYNTIYKERIYANGSKLIHCEGNYKVKATDVRFIKFQTGKTDYRFVYEPGAKVSTLVKKHKATYGVNAPFFYAGVPLGDTEDHDKVIASAYGKMLKWHEFAVVGGKPIIGQLNKNEQQDLLFQCAPMLIENGKLVYDFYRIQEQVNDDIGKSRCQRTFAGIDANGDLTIFIADGRTNSDQGLNLAEMALFAQEKFCVNALNFDGGSSTILADKTGGLNQKLNTGVNERPVNHALLIYVKG